MLLLNSPSNPTGAVYARAELEALAEVAARATPTWSWFRTRFTSRSFTTPSTSPSPHCGGMRERTVTVNGFSKAYAMTGWRLGYLAAPELDRRRRRRRCRVSSRARPRTITQKAGVAALEMDPEPVRQMVRAFKRTPRLRDGRARHGCPASSAREPEGAFYVFPDVSAYFETEAPSGQRRGDERGPVPLPARGARRGARPRRRVRRATTACGFRTRPPPPTCAPRCDGSAEGLAALR